MRGEYGNYFEALNKHPYTMVGTKVPAIGRDGEITLSSTQDAKDWQDAVKGILADEVTDRASRQFESQRGFLETTHAAVDLFKNNADLIPGARGFDKELADQFAALATPYEVREDGKLRGYSVPVQPIIEHLRKNLAAQRAAAPPPPAAPAAPAARQTPARPAADPPQAGIASKAGSGDQAEDFSTLFGTIGLPNLQI